VSSTLKKLNDEVESLALKAVMVDPGDMAGLAEVLKSMESIETLSREIQDEKLDHLLGAMKGYIEQTLLDLEKDSTDPETINAVFRPFHTIKGVSGFLNF
jgi:two-component system chemotaxis sensor kinase CheA